MELRKLLENKLFELMSPNSCGGPKHLHAWIEGLDDDELVETVCVMARAEGHKVAS